MPRHITRSWKISFLYSSFCAGHFLPTWISVSNNPERSEQLGPSLNKWETCLSPKPVAQNPFSSQDAVLSIPSIFSLVKKHGQGGYRDGLAVKVPDSQEFRSLVPMWLDKSTCVASRGD